MIRGFSFFFIASLALLAPCLMGCEQKPAAPAAPKATYRGEPVSHWTSALQDRDVDYRVLATLALDALSADAATAVPALTDALKDEVPAVRAGAAQALGTIGSAARSAESALSVALEDKDAEVRMSAILAVGQITGTPSADPLVNALKDDSPRVRDIATALLVKMGPPAVAGLSRLAKEEDAQLRMIAVTILGRIKHGDGVPALIGALDDKDQSIADLAAQGLAQTGDASIAGLSPLLSDPSVDKRWVATYTLSTIGSSKAAPALITALNDRDERIRDLATGALSRIGKDAVEPLTIAAKSENVDVRLAAINALGGMARQDTIPILHAALKDEEPMIRDAAVAALGNTGSAKAVPALTEAIQNKDVKVRADAVQALVKLGADSLSVLVEASKDKDWQVRRVATDGMGMLASSDAVPALNRLLLDDDERVRSAAALAIAKVGPSARLSISPLINTLKDKSDVVRDGAAYALAKLAPGNDTVIPALIRALRYEDVRARVGAANSIARLGPLAPSAVFPLITGLKDTEDAVVLASRLALVKLGPEAITGILKALREEDARTRLHLIDVLGQIGADAAPAIHVLLVLLQDDDPQIKNATILTLGLIGGNAKSTLLKASRGEDPKLAAAAAHALEVILKQ